MDRGGNKTVDSEAVLNHILECETCLAIVSDPHVATELCEIRCPEYYSLVSGNSSQGKPDFRGNASASPRQITEDIMAPFLQPVLPRTH